MRAAELIADALVRLPASPPDVRKAALLRIARVQRVVSPPEARATLEAGLALDPGLADAGRRAFEHLSRLAVAAVAPERLTKMPPTARGGAVFSNLPSHLAQVMRDHGQLAYLRTYVLHDAPLEDVPFTGIEFLAQSTDDKDEHRLLLRRALEVRRATPEESKRKGVDGDKFFLLFHRYWKLLPPAEAMADLTLIIDDLLSQPDSPVTRRVGDVLFTSGPALEIFRYFDILVELDPERAGRLRDAHPELAKAVARYPNGLRTIEEEMEARLPQVRPQDGGGRIAFVSSDYARALLHAEQIRDFTQPLKYAADSYREDCNPANRNPEPKDMWPSGEMYKAIFLRMGKILGETASATLTSVPDVDLLLLAQIEFAAGLCGLPEMSSLTHQIVRSRSQRA